VVPPRGAANASETFTLSRKSSAVTRFAGKLRTVGELFSAYEDFLGVLSDKSERRHLEDLTPDQLETDAVYADAREISHRFGDAVQSIFLNSDNPIGQLTIRYGVF
jgi:hypothetical protein